MSTFFKVSGLFAVAGAALLSASVFAQTVPTVPPSKFGPTDQKGNMNLQTPAMAAGITDHCWTVRELLSCRVPPPRWTPPKQRGRPSHALKRLMARWCGDHG